LKQERLLYYLKRFKSGKRYYNLSKKDQKELSEIITEINCNSSNELYWVDQDRKNIQE